MLSRVIPACLIAFFLLGSQTVIAVAQEAGDKDDVVRVNTELLLFPIRIRDKKGQAIAGLTEADLTLKDQDRATTGIYFSPGADRVAMLFALDQSGSVRETIARQQDAALSLFSRFSDRSSIAVLRFSDTPTLVASFSSDFASVREAFMFAAERNRRTAIFDAAAKAVQAFDALPPVRTERRIVILISDGLDNRSTTKPDRVISAALERRVSFYVIHLPLWQPRGSVLALRPPSKGFLDLAEKTGGKYFMFDNSPFAPEFPDIFPPGKLRVAPGPKGLDLIFQAIEEDLKSQYLLGFYIAESSRDNRKHVWSVSLKPDGLEYSVGRLGFSRTHKFMINQPPAK